MTDSPELAERPRLDAGRSLGKWALRESQAQPKKGHHRLMSQAYLDRRQKTAEWPWPPHPRNVTLP
jgi:hypothetical protein